jgi:SAM-dependent methyltransferase
MRSMNVDHQIRGAYDSVAAPYAEKFADELAHKPLDRGLLRAFSEQAGNGELVADIGCGPGHVAGFLAELGITVRGIDLSPEMIRIARRRHPGIEFIVGELPGLGLADGELAGAVLFYSVIHMTTQERVAAFAELGRALRPGGLLLVAFHIGEDEKVHLDTWFGKRISLDGYLLSVRTVTDEIVTAGLSVSAILQRASYPEAESLGTQRGYVLARKTEAG